MHRFLIFGSSGSGKATSALQLAREHGIPRLDLDLVAWDAPGRRKTREASRAEIAAFAAANAEWELDFLLRWVAEYETRGDEHSLARNRELFERFPGPKRETLRASSLEGA